MQPLKTSSGGLSFKFYFQRPDAHVYCWCHEVLPADNWFQAFAAADASLATTCGSSPSLHSPWSFVLVQEKLHKHITELHFGLFWTVSSSAAAAKYLAEHEKWINPLLRIVPQQMHCVLLSG